MELDRQKWSLLANFAIQKKTGSRTSGFVNLTLFLLFTIIQIAKKVAIRINQQYIAFI
jgi:hypothetical protein